MIYYFFRKITTIWLKYKLIILTLISILGFSIGILFLYKILWMKAAIKSAIILASVQNYVPTPKEDILKSVVETTNLVIEYGVGPTFNPINIPTHILEKMCPTNTFKMWLEQFHPDHLLKDKLGRDYFVITNEINKEYVMTRPGIRELKIRLLERLDPSGYHSYNSSFARALEHIKKNNINIETIQKIVAKENLNMTDYKNWLFTGCVIALIIGCYCAKKSVEILVITN